MDNPSKTGRLARLCTIVLKTGFPLQGSRPVHTKGEEQAGNRGRVMRAGRSLRSSQSPREAEAGQSSPAMLFSSPASFQKVPSMESSPPHTFLRGRSEEKVFCGAAVAVKNFPKQGPQAQIFFPAQGEKVIPYLFPRLGPLWGAYTVQIVPSSERGMSTSKSSKKYSHPAGHQPGGHTAVLINFHRGAMEAPLPCLPAVQAQEQCPQERTGRVLEIGNQLDGQQGQGCPPPSTQEASNGNAFLRKPWKQLNRVPPVGSDLTVAVLLSTDGAGGSDDGGKVNPPGKKRFLVFPNRLTCVRVGKLNCSATLPTGGRSLALTPLGLLPCGSWLFFQGQFLTSEIRPPLYHRSENPVNTAHSNPSYKESNNMGDVHHFMTWEMFLA
jgi:hypothetical protein